MKAEYDVILTPLRTIGTEGTYYARIGLLMAALLITAGPDRPGLHLVEGKRNTCGNGIMYFASESYG
jgi:hypothetical protein